MTGEVSPVVPGASLKIDLSFPISFCVLKVKFHWKRRAFESSVHFDPDIRIILHNKAGQIESLVCSVNTIFTGRLTAFSHMLSFGNE